MYWIDIVFKVFFMVDGFEVREYNFGGTWFWNHERYLLMLHVILLLTSLLLQRGRLEEKKVF